MRKYFSFLVFSTSILLFLGCSQSCSKSDTETTDSATSCLVGTWSVVENNFTKSFTFNANNTGTEVQAADDVRSFTWSIKDGKPTVVYVNELTEWQFTLSCESNRLTVFGLVYTKL